MGTAGSRDKYYSNRPGTPELDHPDPFDNYEKMNGNGNRNGNDHRYNYPQPVYDFPRSSTRKTSKSSDSSKSKKPPPYSMIRKSSKKNKTQSDELSSSSHKKSKSSERKKSDDTSVESDILKTNDSSEEIKTINPDICTDLTQTCTVTSCDPDKGLCKICLDADYEMIAIPCGHYGICQECCNGLWKDNEPLTCPFCSRVDVTFYRVFKM